jgi:hypothetical protein
MAGMPKVITSQTGGREFNQPDLLKYSLFVGGVNATFHALRNYSPMLNGFGRLFMVRPPYAILKMFAGNDNIYSKDSLFIQFKHMLEYMNRSVTGFAEKALETASTPIQGGFAGRQFQTPTVTKETTSEVVIGLYELTGSPILTVIDGWMNAIGDENSGLATYGGWISGGKDEHDHEKRLYKYSDETSDEGIPFNESMHTAEFIYVVHDRSGAQVERAVLLADCWPKGIQQQTVLDMPAGGTHDNVTYDLTFNAVVYRSPIITAIANDLLKQYRIVGNSLNFNPELGDAVYATNNNERFSRSLGRIPLDAASGTHVGNLPAYKFHNKPVTKDTVMQIGVESTRPASTINLDVDPRLAGQADTNNKVDRSVKPWENISDTYTTPTGGLEGEGAQRTYE